MKPKVHLNHQEQPGKGKSGRVNANEPLMRLRDSQLAGGWLTKTARKGHCQGSKDKSWEDTSAPE